MYEKPKLVDYSFSTSESEEEPAPKRRAIGVVKPISQPIPEESPEEIPEQIPNNPQIPQQNIIQEQQIDEQQIIVLSSETSDTDTISIRTATTFGKS